MVSVADMNAVHAKIEESAGPDFVRVRGSVSNLKILLDWEALDGWESDTKPLGTCSG